VLWLLSTAPNPVILEVLAEGPSSLVELQRQGGAPGTTLRARLKELIATGAILIRRDRGVRRVSSVYELTEAGRDLLPVAAVLERWLGESPNAAHAFGGSFAKAAIDALAEGWTGTLLRALAAKPLSIADLDNLIGTLNYPSLERRIAAMRNVGLVEACRSNGRETPYSVTPWLRRGVAPILAAVRWEWRHLQEGGAPVTGLDVEAAFLLAIALLELDPDFHGSCRLAVELPDNGAHPVAGALAVVEGGAVRSCRSRLDGDADAWASGTLGAWLRALIEGDHESLEVGGDGRLARGVTCGMHRALFVSATRDRDERRLGAGIR
jgi:DNA-binding HxlR family transcriptional regulator